MHPRQVKKVVSQFKLFWYFLCCCSGILVKKQEEKTGMMFKHWFFILVCSSVVLVVLVFTHKGCLPLEHEYEFSDCVKKEKLVSWKYACYNNRLAPYETVPVSRKGDCSEKIDQVHLMPCSDLVFTRHHMTTVLI